MATTSSESRWRALREEVTLLRGSLICLLVVFLWDVVLSGSFLFSFFFLPIWFVAAVIRAIVLRPGWGVAFDRILMPFVAGLLVVANCYVQGRIARANSERLIQACEQYREASGAYPERLDDLVPRYLSSVPRAKYCCFLGEFMYWGPPRAFFWWVEIPPFGRRVYDLETGEWSYLD